MLLISNQYKQYLVQMGVNLKYWDKKNFGDYIFLLLTLPPFLKHSV